MPVYELRSVERWQVWCDGSRMSEDFAGEAPARAFMEAMKEQDKIFHDAETIVD